MTFSKKLVSALLPALLLTGCAGAPVVSATPTPASVTACLVVDSNGLADGSVNESAYSAIKEAVVSYGIQKYQKVVGVKVDAFEAVVSMIRRDCNVVVATGAKLSNATIKAAKANPDIAFVLIDDVVPTAEMPEISNNLKHLVFDAGQTAILAGYLAAASSKTGVVATFGSTPTPGVLASMQGFKTGVSLFNDQTDSNVEALGVIGETSEWTFAKSSSNRKAGERIANKLFENGADIIYPVAGSAGLGAGDATLGKAGRFVIGSGRDWFMDTDNRAWRANVLASTVKQVSRPILQTITDFSKDQTVGNPATNLVVGTLGNKGIGLTEERDLAFGTEFRSALSSLLREINAGTIETPKGQN